MRSILTYLRLFFTILLGSFLWGQAQAASGFTVDYVNVVGGGDGFGNYGEIYSLWSHFDKGGIPTGLQNIGGLTTTYRIRVR